MSVWQKLFSNTVTASPIETAYIRTNDRLLELIAQQQATLDRIVTAKYDRPVERVVHPPSVPMFSDFALDEQGQVRPDDPIAAAIDNINVESDVDFLASVSK